MIDIHCHLLPQIDDGPSSLEDAMALADALVRDGITHVVATPHVFPGRFENRRSSIQDDAQRFNELLQASGLPLQLSWAGEVRLSEEVLGLLGKNELPYLGHAAGLRNLLLEMPDGQIPLGTERLLAHLVRQRIQPILVHPERNRAVMERADKIKPLIELGCLVQLTAGSLVGQFGAKAMASAQALLAANWVHVVASDAHNLGGRRPRMQDAYNLLARDFGQARAHQLCVAAPARLCGISVAATQA